MLDGAGPAGAWRRAHGPAFVTTAITDRAVWWSWRRCRGGWAFEIAFHTERIRDEFTGQPLIKAALADAPGGFAVSTGDRRR